jgi:uncharacterized cupredoxin-like copper-binding protein
MTLTDTPPEQSSLEERLDRIEERIERGNRDGRRAGLAFTIFAVGACLLAMASLIAIATKLQGKSSNVNISANVGPPAKPAAAAPVPASRVQVALREFTVTPSTTLGRAGRVAFSVDNAGTVPHEFVVIRTSKPAGALLKGARADETGNVGETGDLQPGEAKTIHLNLKPGHYALICNLPGHYAAGQHTDFTVR